MGFSVLRWLRPSWSRTSGSFCSDTPNVSHTQVHVHVQLKQTRGASITQAQRGKERATWYRWDSQCTAEVIWVRLGSQRGPAGSHRPLGLGTHRFFTMLRCLAWAVTQPIKVGDLSWHWPACLWSGSGGGALC